MKIRQATEGDYSKILQIRKPILSADTINLSSLGNTGFVIGEYPEDDFHKDLAEIFLVAEESDKVKGYVVFSNTKEYIDNKTKIWSDTNAKLIYYSPSSIELKVVFVSEDSRNIGLGQKLLSEGLAIISKKYDSLFSIVTLAPIANYASLNFHLRNDFKIVSVSLPTNLFGMEGYQSMLLMKDGI